METMVNHHFWDYSIKSVVRAENPDFREIIISDDTEGSIFFCKGDVIALAKEFGLTVTIAEDGKA